MTDAVREKFYRMLNALWTDRKIADWRPSPEHDRVGERAFIVWMREDR